jgi:hypothetical protein
MRIAPTTGCAASSVGILAATHRGAPQRAFYGATKRGVEETARCRPRWQWLDRAGSRDQERDRYVGNSHRYSPISGWDVPPVAATAPASLDHHDENDAALVPSANPVDAPAVGLITEIGGLEEAQELGLNFHGNPWMALSVETVKAGGGVSSSRYAVSWELALPLVRKANPPVQEDSFRMADITGQSVPDLVW